MTKAGQLIAIGGSAFSAGVATGELMHAKWSKASCGVSSVSRIA
jgi:hypothetical protein